MFTILLWEYGSVLFYVVLHEFDMFLENSFSTMIFLKKELYESMRTFTLHFVACPVTVFSIVVPHAEHEPTYLLEMAGILKWTLSWQNLIFKRPLCLDS